MKTFKEVVGKKLDEIYCDVCGKSCMKSCDNEHASLWATWGYDSKKDLTRHDIDLCEDCFDKTIEFLKSQRIARIAGEDDPFDGSEYGISQ
jgi:hypothetical protein